MILNMTYDTDQEHLIVKVKGKRYFSEGWVNVVPEEMTIADIVEGIEYSLDEESAYE